MLPIAFIPMDVITFMLYLFEFIVKRYGNFGIPSEAHPLSLEKYMKENNLIPSGIKLGMLNKAQRFDLSFLEPSSIRRLTSMTGFSR